MFRRTIVLIALFILCACGFHPMYGDAAKEAAQHSPLNGNLVIDPISGREGQVFRNELEDRLNPDGEGNAKNAQYRLQITLLKTLIPSVVKSDGTIQRYDIRFDSTFILFDVPSKKVLFNGALRRTGSYNVAVNANFASYEAQQDTVVRTLKEMAEDYNLRISGYFASHPDK